MNKSAENYIKTIYIMKNWKKRLLYYAKNGSLAAVMLTEDPLREDAKSVKQSGGKMIMTGLKSTTKLL